MLKVTISTWKCLFLFFFCAFGDSCLLFAYTCTVVAVCKVIKSSICWLRSCGFFFAFPEWRKQTTGLAADNEYFCTLHHIDSSWYMTVSNEYLFAAYLDCWRLKLLFFSFLLALYSESSQTVRVFHFFFFERATNPLHLNEKFYTFACFILSFRSLTICSHAASKRRRNEKNKTAPRLNPVFMLRFHSPLFLNYKRHVRAACIPPLVYYIVFHWDKAQNRMKK